MVTSTLHTLSRKVAPLRSYRRRGVKCCFWFTISEGGVGADWGAARASIWPLSILQGSSTIASHLVHRHCDQDWRNPPINVIGLSPDLPSRTLRPDPRPAASPSLNEPSLCSFTSTFWSHRLSSALSHARPFSQDTCGGSCNAPRLSSLLTVVLVLPCASWAET